MSNREKERIKDREYYHRSLEKSRKRSREYKKKYLQRNPLYYEEVKKKNKRHYFHLRVLLFQLLGKFECEKCGRKYSDGRYKGLQIHFKIPIDCGGKVHPDNVEVLCAKCHGKTRRLS